MIVVCSNFALLLHSSHVTVCHIAAAHVFNNNMLFTKKTCFTSRISHHSILEQMLAQPIT